MVIQKLNIMTLEYVQIKQGVANAEKKHAFLGSGSMNKAENSYMVN